MHTFLIRWFARAIRGRLICGVVVVCAAIFLNGTARVWSQEAPKGLSKEQVLKLLKEDPAPRVQYLVNKYGIGFYLTAEAESELRNAGATPDVMEMIRRLAPQRPAEVKPPLTPAPPTLVIRAKPGEAEVYVDDERRGQTNAEGALRLSNLAAGSHKLRISLQGYRSYEVGVDLSSGETNTLVAELQPNPPPAAPVKEEAGKDSVAAAVEKPRGDPNDPLSPHAPGIYYMEQDGSTHKLMELEEAPPGSRAPSAGRGSAFGGFGSFGGAKWKTVIFGEKARLRVGGGRPVFYFYFPTVDADASTFGLSHDAFRHTNTPGGFVLVHLQTHKNLREIPAKGSATATVDEKETVPFSYENSAAGIYKVQLKADLGPGEYGFLYGGMLQAMMQTWLFDFGVDKSK